MYVFPLCVFAMRLGSCSGCAKITFHFGFFEFWARYKRSIRSNMTNVLADYFRQDQEKGVTAPDLSKDCTYAEHIVRARGKRTQLTSVSLDPKKINDFGPTLYRALRQEIGQDQHTIVEHAELMSHLRQVAESSEKEERARAIQAQRYAKRRLEGLLKWNFPTENIGRKELIAWAFHNIQKYFRKV
jgi:hypothetical protein